MSEQNPIEQDPELDLTEEFGEQLIKLYEAGEITPEKVNQLKQEFRTKKGYHPRLESTFNAAYGLLQVYEGTATGRTFAATGKDLEDLAEKSLASPNN